MISNLASQPPEVGNPAPVGGVLRRETARSYLAQFAEYTFTPDEWPRYNVR